MKVTRALETKVLQGFNQKEGLLFNPRKILLIGTLGSGKTTVAQRLARDTGFPYASIDGCRIRYGDGTVDGEERTWENFLHLIYIDEPLKRDCYTEMCRLERWSVRTLRAKLDGMVYERTALSKKPEELAKSGLAALRNEDRMTPALVMP